MKLTDTQLVLLSAASQRQDAAVESGPEFKGGAADKVIDKLGGDRSAVSRKDSPRQCRGTWKTAHGGSRCSRGTMPPAAAGLPARAHDMRFLLFGGAGQVGEELRALPRPPGVEIAAPTRAELDLTDAHAIARIVAAERWSAVINAAAYTEVDRAESEERAAFAVNARPHAASWRSPTSTAAILSLTG
jgi:hypothetical protein